MKRIFILFILVLITSSCRERIVEFESSSEAKIYVSSSPNGADIYLSGVLTNKQTPDSLTISNPGLYKVKVRLVGYVDVEYNVYLTKGEKRYIYCHFQ